MVSATTLADSLLLHVARDVVYAETERDPGFARRIIAGLSRRLHHLIGYLLRDESAIYTVNSLGVTLPDRKGVIASHLSLTHEHFSRILHELIEAGRIEVGGPRATIPDIARLRSYGT